MRDVYICTYMDIYIYECINVYIFITHKYIHDGRGLGARRRGVFLAPLYVFMYIYTHIYICTYANIYIYINIHIYICTHMYIFAF